MIQVFQCIALEYINLENELFNDKYIYLIIK